MKVAHVHCGKYNYIRKNKGFMQPKHPALFFLYMDLSEKTIRPLSISSHRSSFFSLCAILYFAIPYSLKARFLNDCVSIHFISIFHNFLNIFLV